MISDAEKQLIEQALAGKRIASVDSTPTRASFISFETGSLTLVLEGNGTVTFGLSCSPTSHHLTVSLNGRKVADI